jgi:hypothetical protein
MTACTARHASRPGRQLEDCGADRKVPGPVIGHRSGMGLEEHRHRA